ncbi:MAG: hypothetical protein LBT47_11940 [Deltaproteobacteria bacterium]|jgi:hypothetical protein|nr:hypothetical protein [Deltaproteobacteria bacterium]
MIPNDLTQAELRAQIERLEKENTELRLKILSGVIKVCSGCKNIQTNSGDWVTVDRFLELYSSATCSHGYCDSCAQKMLDEVLNDSFKG